jgi:hypothetical protein
MAYLVQKGDDKRDGEDARIAMALGCKAISHCQHVDVNVKKLTNVQFAFLGIYRHPHGVT